jgi:hypothetical protein
VRASAALFKASSFPPRRQQEENPGQKAKAKKIKAKARAF